MFVFVTSLSFIVHGGFGKHKHFLKENESLPYNRNMKQAIQSVFPHYFSRHSVYWYRLVLAGVYVFLVIMQLFTFEKFPNVIETFGLPGSMVAVTMVAMLLPILEVLSLPFLLSMSVARILHAISRMAVLAVAAVWFAISLWLVMMAPLAESGIFGATISLPAGWWLVGYCLVLLVVAILCVKQPFSHKKTDSL